MNILNKKVLNHNKGLSGCIIFLMASICILSCASASSAGAFEGLKICSRIIIPSLFPFTVAALLFQKSGSLLWIGNRLNKITYPLFKITGLNFSVILISLIGGYPIGAKIINELYNSKELTKVEAERLLRFCINPSPAFFVSAFGINILNSKAAGIILLISNLISCMVLNLIFCRSKNCIIHKKGRIEINDTYFSDYFVESVFEGAKIILNICAFVTLFSSISEIIKPLFASTKLYALFCPILEISFGISKIKNSGIPSCFYSFFLAFGGLSTIFQIKQATNKIKPSFIKIILYRILHGGFATTIAFFLFKCFPESASVISNGIKLKSSGYTLFFPSIMLIVFSVLFLMFFSYKNKQIDI